MKNILNEKNILDNSQLESISGGGISLVGSGIPNKIGKLVIIYNGIRDLGTGYKDGFDDSYSWL